MLTISLFQNKKTRRDGRSDRATKGGWWADLQWIYVSDQILSEFVIDFWKLFKLL